MAVQEVPTSLLEARYASDSEADDMPVAAHTVDRAETTKAVERGTYQAGTASEDDEYNYDSDESWSLEDAAYTDKLAGN